MSAKNLTSAQIALRVGVQRSGISHILSGRNKPSLDFVLKLLEAFPDVNETWLLKGEGEMMKMSTSQTSILEEAQQMESIPTKSPEVDEVVEPVKSSTEPFISSLFESQKEEETGKINEEAPATYHIRQSRKILKIIAIYDDDSFKIFNSQ